MNTTRFSHLTETGVSRRQLAQGRMLTALQDDVRLPDGSISVREYVVHPGAVMIVPILDDGRLVLERQFRYPVGAAMVEFPAGKLDEGEPSLICAQRELREETGYSASQWAYAGTIHPVIGYSTEHIDIWFARGLTLGQRNLDEGEFLDIFTASVDELLLSCQKGEVTDAKTLSGVFWLQNVLSGLWPLQWAGLNPEDHVVPDGPRKPSLE